MKRLALLLVQETSILRLLKVTLKASGFDCLECANHREIFRKAGEFVPHLIVMESLLPEGWLGSFKNGPLGFIPTLVVPQAPISDLLRQIAECLESMEQAPLVSRKFKDRVVTMTLHGDLTEITESNLGVDSDLKATGALETIELSCDLFLRIGIRNPSFRFLGMVEGRTRVSSWALTGWRDEERRKFRAWTITGQLSGRS